MFSLQRQYEPRSDIDTLFYDDLMLTKVERIRLCAATIPQSKCQLWRKTRTSLITGTKGHDILVALKNNKEGVDDNGSYSSDFIEKLMKLFKENVKSKEGIPALDHGNEFEGQARNDYRKETKSTVVEMGIVKKDKFSWAGVSPDGLILNPDNEENFALLEIKCIHSCRDGKILPEKTPYINKEGQLRKGHRYMTQIQLGMWATGAKYTDLFLWTSQDNKIVNVYPDPLI